MDTNTFLDKLYNELKAMGLICNQYDFSVMCGRTPSWFSTLKARGLPITSDAALTLSHNIRRRTENIIDIVHYETAQRLSQQVVDYAQHRIAQRQALKLESDLR